METAASLVLASLAMAAGMLSHLHQTRRAVAREGRSLNECEQRLLRTRRSLEGTANGLHSARLGLRAKAEASFAEAKINEAIAELATLKEGSKARLQTAPAVARG